jgi:hypothetical protein
LLVLGCPECLSSSTDTQPALKCECHSEPTVRLKECSPKASRSISGVSVTDLPSFMQTWCRHIARFCHPLQTKWNTKSKKHSCKNNAYSQCGVTWQTDAVGLQKCDRGLPSHHPSPSSYNSNSPRTFRYHLIYGVPASISVVMICTSELVT